MPSWFHCISYNPILGLAGMDTRVRNFLYDKAVGLLEVWKGRPPLKTLGDIESGLLNATQPPLVERESKHGPDHER